MKAPFLFLVSSLIVPAACAGGSDAPEVAFSRIIHGWTNYSTAFNATHDTSAGADYASIGAFYTPARDVSPIEYAGIVIWSETRAPNFSRFQFRVMVWSSLDAFAQEPRQGNVATWNFSSPTGGSTSGPDATTRGGRPAYELRFNLTNSSVILSNGHAYVVGFAALTDTQSNGELFIPTSSHGGKPAILSREAGNIWLTPAAALFTRASWQWSWSSRHRSSCRSWRLRSRETLCTSAGPWMRRTSSRNLLSSSNPTRRGTQSKPNRSRRTANGILSYLLPSPGNGSACAADCVFLCLPPRSTLQFQFS